LFFNDAHIPSHDQRLFEETFYPFLEWLKPEKIYILGDLIDCKPLGKYRKEPSETYGQQYEYDKAEEVLRTIRGIVGQSTTIDYLLGNHEHRLHNYLCDHPELFGLRTLTFTELLHTNDYGVTVHPYYQDPIFYAGVALEHRDTVRCNSVYTAKSMYEKRGVSGISGHTHRVGIYTKTTLRGEEFWIENGHMSDVKKATYTYHPDWAHGWSVGHLYPDDSRVVVSQVIVRNYRAYFGGHEFAKGKVA
jgi:UDP-2,3-diacylglucosamine pyrophosphatase LpxH